MKEKTKEDLLKEIDHLKGIISNLEQVETNLKQSEIKLNLNESKLCEIQNLAKIGIWELDIKTNKLTWSEEVYKIFELKPQQFGVTYQSFLENVHPNDRDFVDRSYAESLKNKTQYDIIHRILLSNGTQKWVNEHCQTFYNDAGVALRSIGTIQDITDKENAKILIQESEQKYHALFLEANYGIIYFDKNLKVIDVNPAITKISGLPADSLIGKSSFFLAKKYLSPPLSAQVTNLINSTLSQKDTAALDSINAPFELEYNNIIIEVLARRLDNGCIIAFIKDITPLKNSHKKINELNQKLRSLVKHIEDVRDSDFARIAHDLHDDLGQNLTALDMNLSYLRNKYFQNEDDIRERMDAMKDILKETIFKTQKIAQVMHPTALFKFGLQAAIELLLPQFEKQTGIKSHANIHLSADKLSSDATLQIYRILQESLTNIARHAKATQVTIDISQITDFLEIKIHDNGIGIKEEAITSVNSFGLMGIQERILWLNGRIEFKGTNRGTLISIYIPF